MKQFSFNSIHSRLTYWFLFLTLIPLLFTLTIVYYQSTQIIENRTINNLTVIRDLKVNQLNFWLNERKGDMNILQNDFELINLESVINKTSYNQNDKTLLNMGRNHLRGYMKNNTAYDELYLINPLNGKILISTSELVEGEDQSLEDHFTIPMQSGVLYIEDIHFSNNRSKFTMNYSIPIFSDGIRDNPIIGVLVASIDLDNSLYKILSDRNGLGETGETLIVNKDVIALNELRWFEDAPLNFQITAAPAVNAAKGNTGILKTTDYRGEHIMAAYTYIPEMGWGFVCKQDMFELNATIRKIMLNFTIIFIIISTVIILFSFRISNTISKPIKALNLTAKKISLGDYSIKNTINTSDEIGSLSISINEMANSIKSKINIQKKITNISNNLIGQSSLEEFCSNLLKQLSIISEANWGAFYIIDELTLDFHPFITVGVKKELLKSINGKGLKSEFGLALSKKDIFHLGENQVDIIFTPDITNGLTKSKEIIIIPILIDDIIIAFVSLSCNKPITNECNIVIASSQVNISNYYSNLISNLRVKVLADNVLKINDALDFKTKNLIIKNRALSSQKILVDEANKELEAFSYSVSHDLRAPLRHIDGFTKILYNKIRNKIDEKSKIYFDNIISSSKQMNELIDDLLIFSRMGRKDLNKININMNNIVDNAIQTFSLNIKKNNISVIIDDMPDVKGDASLLTQVWINLISNAIKFTVNTKSPKIHIGAEKDNDDSTVYFIKDNGNGFDQKYVDKIFGVFQRLHNINEFPGTGIGLATVKRIIMKHNGKIWAEGKINKGASLFFKLNNT